MDRHDPRADARPGLLPLTARPRAARRVALRAAPREAGAEPMSERPLEARAVARLTNVVGVAGTRGRTVGSWLDLARSVGGRSTLRRLRGGGPGGFPPPLRHAGYPGVWADAPGQGG